MENFAVFLPREPAEPAFDELLVRFGGHLEEGTTVSGTIQRPDAMLFLFLDTGPQDEERLVTFRHLISWTPRAKVLISVSNRDGSYPLAFQVAEVLLNEFSGFTDWGADWIADNYAAWKIERGAGDPKG